MGLGEAVVGPWFITPTALDQWLREIDPSSNSDEDAYREIAAWAEDAERHSLHEGGKLVKYRARRPLRCYFLVDESEYPKPALVGVLRPHARFNPGHFERRTQPEPTKRSPGRPRTITPPEANEYTPAPGEPKRTVRMSDGLWEWCQAQKGGAGAYIRRLIDEDRRQQ